MQTGSAMVWCTNLLTIPIGPPGVATRFAVHSAAGLSRPCWVITHSARWNVGNAYVTVTTAKPVLCPWRDLAKETNP